MSFENTACPCGGTKERETMICPACSDYLKDHPAMKSMNNEKASVESRRHAAIVIVTCARARGRKSKSTNPTTQAA